METKKPEVKDLKCVYYREWSDDPPAGETPLYYGGVATAYESLLPIVDEVYGHFEDYVYDDDLKDLNRLYKRKKPTRKYLESFYFDFGGCGCDVALYAEGEEIVSKAASFAEDILDDLDIDDCTEELEEKTAELIAAAREHPDDYDAVMALLDHISDIVDILFSYM